MEWKDVGSKIADAAPLLGSLFGPVGTGIGAGIKLLASAFGLKESETTPEKINALLSTDPTAALKLAEIESSNKIELQKLVIEAERMRLADVADARGREVKIVQSTGGRDWNLYALAWLVVFGFFLLCYALMRVSLPAGSNEVVFMLFGSLATGFGTVLQYFFGSSKSSSDKTALLSKQ